MTTITTKTPEPLVDRNTTAVRRALVLQLAAEVGIASAERFAFLDAVLPGVHRAAHNLAVDRPVWFEQVVRDDFIAWMEDVADDEDEVDRELVERDDDLLRDVLRRASATGASPFAYHSDSDDMHPLGQALSNPDVLDFLEEIEAEDRFAFPRQKQGIVAHFFAGFEEYLTPQKITTDAQCEAPAA